MSRTTLLILTGLFTAHLCISDAALAQSDYRYAVFLMPSLGGEDSVVRGLNAFGSVTGWAEDAQGRPRPTMWLPSGDPVDLGTLGGDYGQANAINSSGTIVGWANLPGGGFYQERAFVLRNGKMSDLGTLGGDESEAYAINEAGDIVGQSLVLPGEELPWHAVLWRDGQVLDLGAFERSSQAHAISNAGLIVGQAWMDAFGGWRAVLWENAQIRDLGSLQSDNRGQSWAFDVNDAGYVVGGAAVDAYRRYHAFVWFEGEMHDLGTLPAKTSSHAKAINNQGQIVGFATSGSPNDDAFLWEQGKGMQQLDTLIPPRSSWRFFEAKDINDAGQIVGYGTHRGAWDLLDGYLLTPVHSTLGMAAPSPGVAGTSNTITVSNNTPGARVHFLYSRRGGGTRIPGCDLQQNALQLDNPTIIGSAVADANGVAAVTRNVPLIARGQTILFQAVVQNECAISQLVVHQFE